MRSLVTIFVYAFVLDALLAFADTGLGASHLRDAFAWVTLGFALLLYVLGAFMKSAPLRIIVPATITLVWTTVCGGFPLHFLAPEHTGLALAIVQSVIALLLLLTLFRWRRIPPPPPSSSFPWGRFAGIVLLAIVLVPVALAAGAINALGTGIEAGTDGYVKLRPEGLLLEEREFAKDGKCVRLVSMMHIGRKGFYDQIYESLHNDDSATVLLEGISDEKGLLTERFSYLNFAKLLGLSSQESSDLQQAKPFPGDSGQPEGDDEPQVKFRHADIDVSHFNPTTIEFINAVGALLSSPSLSAFLQAAGDPASPLNRAETNEIVFDDILHKRNDHLIGEIDNALKTSPVVIVPWGALHLPDIELALVERGFAETHRIQRQVVAFRPDKTITQ